MVLSHYEKIGVKIGAIVQNKKVVDDNKIFSIFHQMWVVKCSRNKICVKPNSLLLLNKGNFPEV